ncbi:MAG: CaiB/BaiF CoA transferase family protein [Pseudomonadales bacterium]
MAQAFDGIRIIDFTQVFAGPYAVMQLALLGAEVIKIEQPGTGDQTRGLMNASEDSSVSPSFLTMNVNKRSLTLNLKTPEGIDIAKRLVTSADVVVENFKAGTMDRMGLGWMALKAIKPDLIYCAISGYGQTGPKAGEAAYDGAIQAASGMMSQNGHPSTGPTRTGYMPVDMSTALNSAFSISAALFRRSATGSGQFIDMSMMDTAMVLQAAQLSNYLNQNQLNPLQGNASPTKQPTANVFPTADGFIQITALRQNQVEQLFSALSCESLLEDPRFETPKQRAEHPTPIAEIVADKLRTQNTAHWMNILPKSGVPAAEVRTLPEVLEDPQLAYRDVIESLSGDDDSRSIHVVKAGYRTDQDGPLVRSPSPNLGEHSEEILSELGLTSNAISELRKKGIV